MLLTVKNLRTYFRVGFDRTAKAVDGISFDLEQGKTLALVGESGCGKTQTAFSLIRLIAENGWHPSGEIRFNNRDLATLSEEEMRDTRGNDISMIFQEPMSSLNPLYRIGNQLEEPLRLHRRMEKGEARQRTIELLQRVGIPDPDKRIDNFPHELSGGMKQRVMIAMALACEPQLLIADEPTTALDVTIQAQVLKLMADLQQQTGMAILLITHDMGIVNQMADDICIMYAGKIVEQGSREKIFSHMAHPYTRRLFDSIPKPGDAKYYLRTIPGMVPSATEYVDNCCLFHDRCPFTMEVCRTRESAAHRVSSGHLAACHLLENAGSSVLEADQERIPAPPRAIGSDNLISVKNLKTWFPVRKGILRRVAAYVKAVDDVSLDLKRGATLALVGESGCGKTTFGESILRLSREARGQVLFNGRDLMSLPTEELKKMRRHLQAVFQDPFGSLSPRMIIQDIVSEGLHVHFPDVGEEEKRQKVADALGEVGLGASAADRYPHEFSGGQRQRIAIARALILEPEFILLDEPTSALDVSVQAQVLNLLRELQGKRNLTYLFITHNLSTVRYLADTVAIMYLGRIVEYAPVEELFGNPRHPYTRSLLKAVPSLEERKPFENLVGDVPSPLTPPSGCHFHPRCPIFLSEPDGSPLQQKCRSTYPEQTDMGTSYVRCHAVGG
ncbi:MAG: dipeptide ABC transporter ATP-binding protein [Nitrospinales bacterium]